MRPQRLTVWILIAATLIAAALAVRLFLTAHSGSGALPSANSSPAGRAPSPPEVAIQDGKTIDFSTGKPVVKNSPGDQAIIDAAVKEMEAASQGVTFGPTAAPADEKKKPDPPPAAPKS